MPDQYLCTSALMVQLWYGDGAANGAITGKVTSMPRRTKTEQELGYMRSFWDECRMMQADYISSVGLFAYPTSKPGVWSFRLVFTPLENDAANHFGSSAVQFEYPNSTIQSLAGALWTWSMKLHSQVTDARETHLEPRRTKR